MRAWIVAAVISSSPAFADDWWQHPPIETAVHDAGCQVDAGAAVFDLSVDGTAAGTFLRHVYGARGSLTLAPGHASSAKARLGAASFDTGIDLEQTWVPLKKRPPPLGGILDPEQRIGYKVVGPGLTVAPEPSHDLTWVTPPTLQVPCSGLGWGPLWPDAAEVHKPIRDVAPTATISLRATAGGPVVARVTHLHYVRPLETAGKAVKILGVVDAGTFTAWADEAELVPPPERHADQPGPVGGVIYTPPPKIACELGAPLYVAKGAKLYAVGALVTQKPAGTADWRYAGGTIELDGASRDDAPADAPWLVVTDKLGVTNEFGSYDVVGKFVVPTSKCHKH